MKKKILLYETLYFETFTYFFIIHDIKYFNLSCSLNSLCENLVRCKKLECFELFKS
jgi:hypothetical protein